MDKKIVFIFCALVCFFKYSYSQDTTNTGMKLLVAEGNKLFEKGRFGAALPIWKKILEKNPNSPDANFKVGLCYRYSYDGQAKALPYLKKASSRTVSQYSFYNMTWGQAPVDAIYFLGETYLTLNEPDSALKNFLLYTDLYNGNPPISTERQIRMCLNARNALKSPRNVKLVNMGEPVNSEYSETNPVLTLDNSVVFFSSRRPSKDNTKNTVDPATGKYTEDIYYSRKDKAGKWQSPQPFKYNTPRNEAPLFLSADGLNLYFRREEKNGDVNIYETTFANGAWGEPKSMGAGVNSSSKETGITISFDGKSMYFVSDRVGGQGNSDIYQCTKLANGNWSKPKNLGSTVNTAFNEISPYIGSNGKTLFYSSNGYRSKGIGGYDIYFTELKDDGTWSDPQNIGFPINTTRDNMDYYIAGGGVRYCSAINEGKSYDIFEIQGGGFDVENVDVGKEIVTLTTEMNVTEVVEVEKQVVKEVEVVQMVEGNDESKPKEVEVVDLGGDIKSNDSTASVSAPADSALAQKLEPKPDSALAAKTETQPEPETIKPKLDIDVAALNLDDLDSLDRIALIDKVKKYMVKKIRTNESIVFKTIYFDFNSTGLNLLSRNELRLLLDFLKENPGLKLEIAGHTDSKGPWDANIRVSTGRAKTVHDFLVTKNVSEKKILYYGKASASPIAGNDDETGRKQNRRVEIIVVR